jgi:hypothetical protein
MRFGSLFFSFFISIGLIITSCNRAPKIVIPKSQHSNDSLVISENKTIEHIKHKKVSRINLLKRESSIQHRGIDTIKYRVLAANRIKNVNILTNFTPMELRKIVISNDSTIYSSLSIISNQRSISASFSNDILTQSGDHYFTNGIRITYTSPNLVKNPISTLLHPYPFNGINEYGITLLHNIYTPHNPDSDELRLDDRPFAGVLYLRFHKDTYDKSKNLSIYTDISLGVLGPLSQGGKIQRSIHGKQPDDWVYQISNTPLLNYHGSLSKHLISNRLINISPFTSASFGTVYNNLSSGLQASVGNYFITPGTNEKHRLYWNLYSSISYKYVLYDASLSGGFFSSDNYGLPNKEVMNHNYSFNSGLDLRYNNFQLSACYFYLSREFKLGENHSWGEIKLTYIY